MRKKIDIIFKNKMDDPQAPPLDAWSNIQSRLPEEKKKRPFGFYALFLASGLIVSGLAGTAYYMSGKDSGQINAVQGTPAEIVNSTKKTDQFNIQKNNINPNSESVNPENGVNSTEQQHSFSFDHSTVNGIPNAHSLNNSNNKITAANNNHNFNNSNTAFANKLITGDFIYGKYGLDLPGYNTANHLETINSNHLIVFADPINDENNNHSDILSKKNKNKSYSQMPKFDENRFSFSAFISPTAVNTFVGSSMLSDNMAQFDTENKITLAYGMKAAYALNPRVKVRAGISMVGFEQITKNVPLISDLDFGPDANVRDHANNIDYNGSIRINNNFTENDDEFNNKTTYGNIKQQTQYLEIPVEMEVSVFQTENIGISATGGGSTWIVAKNRLFVNTQNHTEDLGEATNLNSTSFSANAGMKFDLKLSDAINFNVEPHFKYLFNPVNNIEKYNPYSVGVNAGISINLK